MEKPIMQAYAERETYLNGVRVSCTTEEWLRCINDKKLESEIIERGIKT